MFCILLQAPFYERNTFIERNVLKAIFFEVFNLSINLNNVRRIRDRRQRKDIGKCSFVNFSLLALQPPLGVVFYSPLVGFSLLAYEVS